MWYVEFLNVEITALLAFDTLMAENPPYQRLI